MIKRILVGVTGGAAATAKRRFAIDLARRHGAAVEVLSVVDVARLAHVGPVPMGAGYYAHHLVEERIHRSHALADAAVETFEAECRAAGVEVRVLTQEGDPFDVLSTEWRYNDLTILALRDWFDHEVVREPEDTLVRLVMSGVQPIVAVSQETGPIGKALIAYDGSKEAARSMKSFAHYALWPGIKCHVVCFGMGEAKARRLLDRAVTYLRDHGYETTASGVDGTARDRLLPCAEAIGADIIVLGCDHHRALLHRVFGETPMRIIRDSHKAVFLSH